MLPTGLGILAVSNKALEAHQVFEDGALLLSSFEDMIAEQRPRLFPYTPATHASARPRAPRSTCCSAEGLDNVFARHTVSPKACARPSPAWGLKLCAKEPKWHSDTVSAILVSGRASTVRRS